MESSKIERDKKTPTTNKVKNRILKFSPTVAECLERECTKDDFYSEGDKPIGKGGFGQVWKVRHKATDKIYVIKVMSKQNIIEQKMVDQINREIDIMYKLNHPHIIKLVNHFEDDDNLYLIMHLASKGQLYSVLKKQNRFDQRTTAQYMREIISAIKYLHSFQPPIIHRDIKPENILLDENGRVKICDFGWSNYEDKKRTTYCGTPEYLAPEMLRKEGHDTTVDIWDLGVLMFELLTGSPPFTGSNQSELFMNIKKHKIQWPDDFPPLAKNLISKILKQNPKERVTLDEILSHSWFEKNPPIKPILPEIKLDAKGLLESNLISVKPENVKEEIINAVEKEKTQIDKIRQSIAEIKKVAQNSQNNFTGSESLMNSSSIVEINKKTVDELKEQIEKLKKDNIEIKQRSDKFELENKTLKSEIIRLKEYNNKIQPELSLEKLNEELEKYKVMNKDRLGLLAEIEEKSHQILELQNKSVSNENELETTRRNLKATQTKLFDITALLEASEIKIGDLKTQIDTLNKEKEDITSLYQKKIEILQVKLLNNNSRTRNNSQESSTERLLEMIYEAIKEAENSFKIKVDYLEKIMKQMNEESEKCEKKLIDIINERNNMISEAFTKVKTSLEEDFMKIRLKFDKDNVSNERIDWLKKQISELMPYKIKSTNLEMQLSKFEMNQKKLEEMVNLHKINIVTLEKLNSEKDYKMAKKDKYIINIEAKLSDVKDYIFRNHQDNLEEFKKWYKF